MTRNNHNLRTTIMRRVYYAYALRLVLHPVTVHSLFVSVCVLLLASFVSIPNVVLNFWKVGLAEAPRYFLEALLKTEFWNVLLLLLIFAAIVSLIVRVRPVGFDHFHTMQFGK